MSAEIKENLTLTVIVPVYNSQEYLEECINSIKNQTYTNLDIILVDDGSTDSSGKICDDAADKDERVRVIHKKNEGLVAARKTGINSARGDYITFVDCDDYIDLDAYEQIVNNMSDIIPDVIAFGLIEEYPDDSIKNINKLESGIYDKSDMEKKIFSRMLSFGDFFQYGIMPNLVCKFIKRSFLESHKPKISNGVTIGEDVDMTYQMLLNANTLQIMDIAPYHYRKHHASMMYQTVELERLKLLEDDLRSTFICKDSNYNLDKQLNSYITFVYLLKHPEIILGKRFDFSNTKIALYGAGGFGQAFHQSYSHNVVLWVDKNYQRYDSVKPVDVLKESEEKYDIIFIAILNVAVCEEVKKNLYKNGIRKKVIYYNDKL